MTVFGATGGIGGHVVRQALAAGHQVTAVVRDPARFDVNHPALEVATVPGLTDPEVLRAVLEGSDAAISGVGPRGRKDGPVASSTTRGILRAMQASGVRRFVAVSAVPVGPVPDGESFVNRRILLPFISAFARDVYADLAEMEAEIRHSSTRLDDRAAPEAREQAADRELPDRRGRQCAARLLDLPRRCGPPHARRARRSGDPQAGDRGCVLTASLTSPHRSAPPPRPKPVRASDGDGPQPEPERARVRVGRG